MTVTDTGVRTIDGIELTPKAVSLELPAPFATVEDERLHRKQKLAGALRIFGRVGFGEGVAGHITVRDPEFPEYFWVNPFAVSFRHICVSDLILVDHDGNVIYGTRPVNRAAFVIHSARTWRVRARTPASSSARRTVSVPRGGVRSPGGTFAPPSGFVARGR